MVLELFEGQKIVFNSCRKLREQGNRTCQCKTQSYLCWVNNGLYTESNTGSLYSQHRSVVSDCFAYVKNKRFEEETLGLGCHDLNTRQFGGCFTKKIKYNCIIIYSSSTSSKLVSLFLLLNMRHFEEC